MLDNSPVMATWPLVSRINVSNAFVMKSALLQMKSVEESLLQRLLSHILILLTSKIMSDKSIERKCEP